MKRIAALFAAIMILCVNAAAEDMFNMKDAQEVTAFMLQENRAYVESGSNDGDLSHDKRSDTARNGQNPYAVVVCCSDSRVPAEHIFNAGIGEIFVIRTAGNVIGEYELGSIEYGTEHLKASLVLVLGHTQCGAVSAALEGGAHGHIKAITDEIASNLPEGCEAAQAEILNVQNSIERIRESEIMHELEADGMVEIKGAIYNISTGLVEFLK